MRATGPKKGDRRPALLSRADLPQPPGKRLSRPAPELPARTTDHPTPHKKPPTGPGPELLIEVAQVFPGRPGPSTLTQMAPKTDGSPPRIGRPLTKEPRMDPGEETATRTVSPEQHARLERGDRRGCRQPEKVLNRTNGHAGSPDKRTPGGACWLEDRHETQPAEERRCLQRARIAEKDRATSLAGHPIPMCCREVSDAIR